MIPIDDHSCHQLSVYVGMGNRRSAAVVSYKNTAKPVYNDHLMGYFSAFWSSLDELQKADIVNKIKLVPSVFIKHPLLNKIHVINLIIEVVVTDRFHRYLDLESIWRGHYSGTNSPYYPKISRSIAAYIAARRDLTVVSHCNKLPCYIPTTKLACRTGWNLNLRFRTHTT